MLKLTDLPSLKKINDLTQRIMQFGHDGLQFGLEEKFYNDGNMVRVIDLDRGRVRYGLITSRLANHFERDDVTWEPVCYKSICKNKKGAISEMISFLDRQLTSGEVKNYYDNPELIPLWIKKIKEYLKELDMEEKPELSALKKKLSGKAMNDHSTKDRPNVDWALNR